MSTLALSHGHRTEGHAQRFDQLANSRAHIYHRPPVRLSHQVTLILGIPTNCLGSTLERVPGPGLLRRPSGRRFVEGRFSLLRPGALLVVHMADEAASLLKAPGSARKGIVKRGNAYVPALRGKNGQFVAPTPRAEDDGSGVGGTGSESEKTRKRRRPSKGFDSERSVRNEYREFLACFLLRGQGLDWVPYSNSVGPIVELYNSLIHPSKRLGRGKRATLSRFFYNDGEAIPVDKMPRRQCVDPSTGYKARARLFSGFRLPIPDTNDMVRVSAFIATLKSRGRLSKCYSSVDEAVAACVKILGCFVSDGTSRGYVGFPPVAGDTDEDMNVICSPVNGGKEVDALGTTCDALPGSSAKNLEVLSGGMEMFFGTAELHFSALALAAGKATIRFDDAVASLIDLMKQCGFAGVVDRDVVEDVLEATCGADSFRVGAKGFKEAFQVMLDRLGLARALPPSARACFLDASSPKDFVGSRIAARLIAKLITEWNASANVNNVNPEGLSLDVKDVRSVIKDMLGGAAEEVRFELFEKVTRRYLYGAK